MSSYLPASDSVSPSFSNNLDEPRITTLRFKSLKESSSHSFLTASLQLSTLCTSSITSRYSSACMAFIRALAVAHISPIHAELVCSTLSALTNMYGMEVSWRTCLTIVDLPTWRGPEITWILSLDSEILDSNSLNCALLNITIWFYGTKVYKILKSPKQNSQKLLTKFSKVPSNLHFFHNRQEK